MLVRLNIFNFTFHWIIIMAVNLTVIINSNAIVVFIIIIIIINKNIVILILNLINTLITIEINLIINHFIL